MNYNSENCPLTLNTTRICSRNAIDTSIEVSKIGFTSMRPNIAILINENEVFDGIAATPIIHNPINASLLYTDGNSLSKETLNEIRRLSPKGYKGIHVILVGNISKYVSLELNKYGFKTQHIAGRNHYETACIIPSIRKESKNILIISGEDYSEGIIAGYWSAHHGDPILYVQKNKIPCCTLEAIKKMNGINIYVIGSTKTVSKDVENHLSSLDNVKNLERIDGETPYDIAVNFAKYKDPKTEFGWNRNYRDGHAFTFGNLNNPMEIIAGVLFAHMGKHTPPLLIRKDTVPSVVEKYIKSVKPMPPKDMPKPPFMHGFILGSTQNISYEAQISIEDILSIDHEMMGESHKMMNMNHGDMMKHSDDMDHMHCCMHHDEEEKHKMMNMNHGDMMKHSDDMDHMHCCMHHDEEEKHKMMNMNHGDMMKHSDDMDHMHYCMHHDEEEKHKMMKMDHEDMMEHSDDMDHMHCCMHHDEEEKHKMMNMNHGDMMKHSDDMHQMHCMHNEENENDEEMIDNCNHKRSRGHLNSHYLNVNIYEIID